MSIGIYILVLSSMFAVSTSPLIARYLIHVDPIVISFWRMSIGALVLYIYSYFQKDFKGISSGNKAKTLIAGILLGIHFALFYGAISLLPDNLTNATVFGTLAPLFALFIEFYFGRKIDIKLIMGLFIILAGSSIMFINDFDFSSNLTQGNILAVLCSVCFAFVFILSDAVRKKDSAFTFSKSIFFYAALTLAFIAVLMDRNLLGFSSANFPFLLFLGIVPTLIGHSVFYYLVKYLPPTAVASIPLGEPIIVAFSGYYLFPGQNLNEYIIFGGAITIIGLFIIIQTKKT